MLNRASPAIKENKNIVEDATICDSVTGFEMALLILADVLQAKASRQA